MDAIIIGSNHCNTLGLIRSLGMNGVKPYLLLVNEHGEVNYCAKSKYLGGCRIVKGYEDALSFLKNELNEEDRHAILFPSSDGAENMLDTNLNELKQYYTLPGINGHEGGVAYLMNKANQAIWANHLGISTAKTFLVDLWQDSAHAYLGGVFYLSWLSRLLVMKVVRLT